MPIYEIEHPKTGQKIRLEGEGMPSDSDIREAFARVKVQPSNGRTPSYDNRVTDKAEIERRRREFVQNTGTGLTRAKDVVNQAFNPNVQIPAADSAGGFATRVLPQSITQLGPKMLQGVYEGIKGQTDPLVRSLSSLQPTGQLPGPQMERNAGRIVTGLAEAMTAPTGLMGADRAKEAWLTDPAGSALAITPLVKPSLRTLGKVADIATAIPRAAAADTARAAANKLTDMTLKQSTVIKPEIRAKNVKTAQEGGFLPNSKGVDNLNSAIASTEKALADGIAAGDAAQVKGTLDRAISNIQSLREKANRSSDPAANNALIDAEISRLQSHPLLDETGAVNIGTLQKMKVEQGRELAKTYGGEKATQFQNSIDKARVRGMKEELESALDGAFPELAATNRKLGDYYNLKKSLERAANRIENNQGIGIGLPIKGGAGATMGGMVGGAPGAALGAGIGTLIGIIEHPAVAPRLALQLYKASKGSMTMKEAKATVKKRIADLSFVDHAVRKGKDQRGMVGRDINAKWDESKINFDDTMQDYHGGSFDPQTGKININPKSQKVDIDVKHEIYHHWASGNPKLAESMHSRISEIIDKSAEHHPMSKDAIAEAKDMLKSRDISKRDYDRYISQQIDDHRRAIGAGDGLTMASLEEEIAARVFSGEASELSGWFTPAQLKKLDSIVTPAKPHLKQFMKK